MYPDYKATRTADQAFAPEESELFNKYKARPRKDVHPDNGFKNNYIQSGLDDNDMILTDMKKE